MSTDPLVRLEEWAALLDAERPHGIGSSLLEYASAWRAERDQSAADVAVARDFLLKLKNLPLEEVLATYGETAE